MLGLGTKLVIMPVPGTRSILALAKQQLLFQYSWFYALPSKDKYMLYKLLSKLLPPLQPTSRTVYVLQLKSHRNGPACIHGQYLMRLSKMCKGRQDRVPPLTYIMISARVQSGYAPSEIHTRVRWVYAYDGYSGTSGLSCTRIPEYPGTSGMLGL